MSLNPTKHVFGASPGNMLGHVVSEAGISIDPERVKAIQNLPTLNSRKAIHAFMGKINFVRRFIPNFVYIVKHGHNLLKANHTFCWDANVDNAFFRN